MTKQILYSLLGAVCAILLTVAGVWAQQKQEEIDALTTRITSLEADRAAASVRYDAILYRLGRIDQKLDNIDRQLDRIP